MSVFGRISLLLAVFVCVAFPLPAAANQAHFEAVDGVLDLRHWDPKEAPILTLSGPWKVYPKELVSVEDLAAIESGQEVFVPDTWNSPNGRGGIAFGTGYATYALTILLPETHADLSLDTGSIYYASKVFLNDSLVQELGEPGPTRKETVPGTWSRSDLVTFHDHDLDSGSVTVMVQVSNFTHAHGGFRVPMKLGTTKALKRTATMDLIMRLVLIGSALILAIYHIILYSTRTEERAFLAFSAYLFTITVHGSAGLWLLHDVIPWMPANLALRIEYLSMVLGVFAGIQFVWLLYPQTRRRWANKALAAWSGFFAMMFLGADTLHISYILPFMQLGMLVAMSFAILGIIDAVRMSLPGARLMLASMSVVVAGVATGVILYNVTGHYPAALVYASMSVAVLGQASVLGRRVTLAIATSEGLREQLVLANEDLEGQVAERTKMLSQAVEDTNQALMEAHRANRVKSEFLAMMSHEIRTPMNGVLGMASLLKETGLSERQLELLDVIRQSGDDLLMILNDILDISKIEAGELQLEERLFDIQDVLKRCVKLWTPRAEEKGLKLRCNYLAPVDLGLIGDEHRIFQILNNLVSNAIKFTDEGSVTVTVDLAQDDLDEVVLSLDVADTGIGIEPGVRDALFVPFKQADLSTTRKYGGTGLGLTICKRLVDAMSGTIQIKDNESSDQGAVFALTVRLKREPGVLEGRQPQKKAKTEGVSSQASGRRPGPLRVMVVDDNPVSQLILISLLEGRGHQVMLAGDGLAALQRLERQGQDVDLVIMDVQMPNLDGLETTRRIRANEDWRSIPIIGLTADLSPERHVELVEAGMTMALSKPLNQPTKLYTAIDGVLGWSQSGREAG